LNHKGAQFEKVVVVKICDCHFSAFLNLEKNFVDKSVVSILEHVVAVVADNFEKFAVRVLKCSFLNNLVLTFDFVLFVFLTHQCVGFLTLLLAEVVYID
jgi:hypothetical protein